MSQLLQSPVDVSKTSDNRTSAIQNRALPFIFTKVFNTN